MAGKGAGILASGGGTATGRGGSGAGELVGGVVGTDAGGETKTGAITVGAGPLSAAAFAAAATSCSRSMSNFDFTNAPVGLAGTLGISGAGITGAATGVESIAEAAASAAIAAENSFSISSI